MKRRSGLCALALVLGLTLLGACRRTPTPVATPAKPAAESADAFVARVNTELKRTWPELTAAQWVSSTYVNQDSGRLVAHADERYLTQLNDWIAQSRRFDGTPMSPATRRQLQLLRLRTDTPAPRDASQLARLARLAPALEGRFDTGGDCRGGSGAGERTCAQLDQLQDVLRHSRDADAQLQAWRQWHDAMAPMRGDYAQFVQLVDQGARDAGYADAGALWRSGYDMPPQQLLAETDRLWQQVFPLYTQLQCYARARLVKRYGPVRGELAGGLSPAHLLGDMWQQDWSNRWDLLQPYADAGDDDVGPALQAQYRQLLAQALMHTSRASDLARGGEAEHAAQDRMARAMTRRAEAFYVSLGLPSLPDSYWRNSQFVRPRDRDVVCHASAWDMDMAGDVRTKACLRPNADDFATIHHELGHVYYDLAYERQPPLLQAGANDAFHEAVGDTIVLAMTPSYLHSAGLLPTPTRSEHALIDAQMRIALSKVAFLPFGLVVDRWRWGVFDGSIPPARYNAAWWELKARYQGVAPAVPRDERYFDPGAKYHVAANTPYLRYFLADILQFQFYKALCDASGYRGPLHDCSFYGSRVAGERLQAMLARGASQPWQQTLHEMTGHDDFDAAPMLEYFAPLQAWLQRENNGRTCGWQVPAATPPALAPSPGVHKPGQTAT